MDTENIISWEKDNSLGANLFTFDALASNGQRANSEHSEAALMRRAVAGLFDAESIKKTPVRQN